MAISANIFSKCNVALGTNVATCGSVTTCDVVRAESDTLASIFTDGSGNFRNLRSLLVTDFEIKACGVKTNSLYDFLMANGRVKEVNRRKKDQGRSQYWEVEPFLLADQESVFNNVYWSFTGGTAPGGGYDWRINVTSPGGVPIDARWFRTRTRVFLNGVTGAGTVTRTAYRVGAAITTTVAGVEVIQLSLTAENTTFLAAAKVTNPVSGFLTIGAPNVNDYENYCEQIPGINPNKEVPFWLETDRWTFCVDSEYEKWFGELLQGNDYFKKFGDLPLAKYNAQVAANFQQEWLNLFFWSKPYDSTQTLATWRSLPNISSASVADLYLPGEGVCVGKRANVIGVYEQLAECQRVFDLMGNGLNLVEFFELIYDISRARESRGGNGTSIDIFTDRTTAANFQLAMIDYYDAQSSGLLRLNMQVGQSGAFGFMYDSYKLINPPGVTLNIITHNFFNDFKAQASASGVNFAGNMLWILDFASIYPGLVDSNRVMHKTGEIDKLSQIDYNFRCVMKNPTTRTSLNSITWAAIVECPRNSAILEGFDDTVPTSSGMSGNYGDYYTVN